MANHSLVSSIPYRKILYVLYCRIVDHAREVVYHTHFQNTYNDSEWVTIESDYHNFIDIQERHRLLEALTQSRQPWHLYQ